MWDLLESSVFTGLMVMLAPMCAEIARNVVGEIVTWVKNLLYKIWRYFFPCAKITFTFVDDFRSANYTESWDSYRAQVAVFEKIQRIGLTSLESDAKSVTKRCKKAKKDIADLLLIPNNILYKEFIINIRNEPPTEKIPAKRVMTITGKSVTNIKKFVDECMQESLDRVAVNKKQYIYIQTPHDKNPEFNSFPLKVRSAFDHIHLPEKDEIIRLVDRVKSGDRDKLSLLLYGEPGCGKTSIIKSIAAHLKYNVIVIKLAYVKTDAELYKIIHGRDINLGGEYRALDAKRILIFEDIDAESDVVLTRTETSANSSDSDSLRDTIAEVMVGKDSKITPQNHKLTLSGVLNALDGIVELRKSVVILTSNHPEKLDPALLRPGRVDYKIELKRMTAGCANKLIDQYLPGETLPLYDHEITPAALHELLKDAPSIEWLADKVSVEIGRDVRKK